MLQKNNEYDVFFIRYVSYVHFNWQLIEYNNYN